MNPRVLIVDDSLTVRMDLKESLEANQFETITCSTLGAAREAAQTQAYDLAIIDVLLPDGDGLDLLAELKSTPATAAKPVLLLSTEDEVRDRVRGLKRGADDYVGKPYDPGQLVARVRELIRRAGTAVRERPLLVFVDDSPTFTGELEPALRQAGYDVRIGGTGEEGLQLVADLRPDALVIDQQLPGMSGPEVIQRVRADAALRSTPCLLLTASGDAADEVHALEAGADSFCQKHAGLPVIITRLSAILRGSREKDSKAGISSLMGPKRVLAVDDSVTFLGELCEALRAEGYDVAQAYSGEEAIELLGTQHVDGILLDLLMPGLSGQETCRRIKSRSEWRDIPLVILTALDESQAMIEGINAGADDYIAKSADFEILTARLRAQLRRKQFEDENRAFREQLHRHEVEVVEMQALRELSETRATLIESLRAKNDELALANEELRRAKEAVEYANKELESFSYSVSHDLRAPLRHMQGYLEMALRYPDLDLPQKMQRYLRIAADASTEMGQLIDDLLAFSRMGRMEMQHEVVDLHGLVQSTWEWLDQQTAGRDIVLKVDDLPYVKGDESMLRQVFMNLLGNAVKYSRTRPHAVVTVGTSGDDDGRAVIVVRDNGVGFDMQFADKLFGVFQRLHRAEEFEGTGIGLANVRRIISRHGGRTWAEGKPGEGASFYITLARAT